ncbi:MAG: tetratricopeptide repeat protein [Alphaproteobacteria bacterium]
MKSNNPRTSKKSRKPVEPTRLTAHWVAVLTVAVVTGLSFFPVLQNGFVDWDDYDNLLYNANYRGLGWSQLRWMFTTLHLGPYQPLSWVSFGLDYLIWGMNPSGYHLTNLALHAANAVFFYFVCRRLLMAAFSLPDNDESWRLSLSSALAALLFAIHPLRVESVAWVTERRDVLSGFFFFWTIYCYLRANSNDRAKTTRRRWLVWALVFYAVSLLSKAAALTLPVLLLILDIYPLRRLEWNPRQWLVPATRGILREKIPFIIVALPFGLIALLGQQQASALKSVENYGAGSRLAQALFGASFYLWKTLVPVRLYPLHEIPRDFNPLAAPMIAGMAVTLILALMLYRLKNRWPAGFACWLYYILTLAPVLGIVQAGPQLVAERYSYLSCLSWAVLAGGGLFYCLKSWVQKRHGVLALFVTPVAATAIMIMLVSLTWTQIAIWRDTVTLWRQVINLDPNSFIAHYNLARFLGNHGNHTEAISQYREALKIQPADPDAHNNLGLLLATQGDVNTSLEEFQKALEIDPGYVRAFFNMGRVFARQGELDKSVQNYEQALKLSPNESEIHLGLGNVLLQQGKLEAATAQFQEAVKLKPGFVEAHVALARSLAAQGNEEEAENHYQQALELLRLQKKGSPEDS